MSELNKPSTPVTNGKTISVESIAGAVTYTLYRVRYILKNNFRLFDGRELRTRDGAIFTTKNSTELHVSPYTGEQIDRAITLALSEQST